MKKYISLLRGINVSGQKRILMKDLKSLYVSIGLYDVSTYIQSGNVLFNSTENNISEISASIVKAIKRKYGFDVKVIVKTQSELGKIIKQNPFLKINDIDIGKLYVTFMEYKPAKEFIDRLTPNKETNDVYKIIGTEIYLYCPGGYGKTIFSNTYIEKKLDLKTTTGNWKTINKLLQIASE
ncbi:hypothetical protein BMS3Abin04_00045 [bacterium BMS3Abin04]|nr:hypothetical protein BMS3Abin04_00045 [bacterium BMS3Abin04]